MALLDPDALLHIDKRVSVCCRDDDLREFLDECNKRRLAGQSGYSADRVAEHAKAGGHAISTSSVYRHWRGGCGGT